MATGRYHTMIRVSGARLIDNNSNDFRPDGVGSVTHEEKEKFQDIKERLRVLLEHQITNFRFVPRPPSSPILQIQLSVFDVVKLLVPPHLQHPSEMSPPIGMLSVILPKSY